jgi:ABC-type arginine transport system permease subunit
LFKHKKFPKVLTIVFIYFVFDISVRSLLALSSIGRASIWIPAGIAGFLAVGFFVGTCYLFEKKIEG